MMKSLSGAFVLSVFLGALSQLPSIVRADGGGKNAPVFHVQQLDPNFDVQRMAAPGIKIHSLSELKKSELPSRELREQAIHEAKLESDVSNWDELDRDLLYVRAKKTGSVALLAKSYPKLQRAKLAQFQKIVKSQARGR